MGIDAIKHPEIPEKWEPDFVSGYAERILPWFSDSMRFDLAIISDGLEHIEATSALNVLAHMTRLSAMSIVFVPTNDGPPTPLSTDPHAHKSTWTRKFFQEVMLCYLD